MVTRHRWLRQPRALWTVAAASAALLTLGAAVFDPAARVDPPVATAGSSPSMSPNTTTMTSGAMTTAVPGAATSPTPTPTTPPTPTAAPPQAAVRVRTATPLAHSRIVSLPLRAPAYGLPSAPAYVYLPRGYSPSGPAWPVLFLLGAAPGSTDDWLHPGHVDVALDRLVDAGVLKPFVIVMPTTNPSVRQDNECLNTLRGPQVESYILDVVVPTVEKRLDLSTDRRSHVIGGFSAGADCALNVGLHHLNVFSAIATLDAEGAPGSVAEQALLDDRHDLVRANSPRSYIPTMLFAEPVTVYLNAGGGKDVGYSDVLQRELKARGISVVRHDDLGFGHTWADVHADMSSLLSFVAHAFLAR